MSGERSLGTVLGDLVDEARALMRNEIRLAKTEAREKLAALKTGIVLTAVGAIFLFAALLVLLAAAVGALMLAGFSLAASAAIVGGVMLGLSCLLLAMGIQRLKPNHLTPKKTVRELQRDVNLTRNQVHT